MNFASVAAQGVVPPAQPASASQHQPQAPGRPPSLGEPDPSLQAKAPGYKAPGSQRTSSPHIPTEHDQFRAPGYKGNTSLFPPMPSSDHADFNHLFMPSQSRPTFMPPSVGFYPQQPSAVGSNMNSGGGISPRPQQQQQIDNSNGPFPLREEYSTPNEPMTLPKIESNLNAEAPEFMLGSRGGGGGAGFMGGAPFHPAFRNAPAHPAAAMLGQQPNSGFSVAALLTDMQNMQNMQIAAAAAAAASSAGNGSSPRPQQHQYMGAAPGRSPVSGASSSKG